MLLKKINAVVLLLASLVNAETPFCSSIGNNLSADHQRNAATTYCSSYLKVPTSTDTAQASTTTITKTTTIYHTSVYTITGYTITTTSSVIGVTSATATQTEYTTTTTVHAALGERRGPIPAFEHQRVAAATTPSVFSGLSPAQRSKACSCLSVKPAATTVPAHTVTSYVTVIATTTTERTVHPTVTTIETSYFTITRTTTTDDYTTTVTVTAT